MESFQISQDDVMGQMGDAPGALFENTNTRKKKQMDKEGEISENCERNSKNSQPSA